MKPWSLMLCTALSAFPLGAAAQTSEPQMAGAVGELFPGPDKACGVFSLYVSAKLLGANPDLLGISKAAGLSLEGTSLLGLKSAAIAMGLTAEGRQLPVTDWRQVPPFAIMHFRPGHFVTVLRVERDELVIADPPGRVDRMPAGAVEAKWTGNFLALGRDAQKAPIAVSFRVAAAGDQNQELDLGLLACEAEKDFTVRIDNGTDGPLFLDKVESGCSCISLTPEAPVVAAEGVLTLSGLFSTPRSEGVALRRAGAVIRTAKGDLVKLHVDIRSDVRCDGKMAATPSTLQATAVSARVPSPKDLVVRRMGSQPLKYTSFSVTGLDGVRVERDQTGLPDALDGYFHVALPAVRTPGVYRGTIRFSTDDARDPSIEVPFVYTVQSEVEAIPSAVVLPARNAEETLVLRSRTGTPFTIDGVTATPDSVSVSVAEGAERKEWKLVVRGAFSEGTTGIAKATLSIKTSLQDDPISVQVLSN